MPTRALSALALLLALGCQGSSYGPVEIQLVDGQGGNPFVGANGSLTITVLQSGVPAMPTTTTVTNGDFSVDVPIVAYDLHTAVSAEFVRPGMPRMIGATIPFYPVYGATVVMGEVGTCVSLSEPNLSSARRAPGLALFGANLISLGGLVNDRDPVARVDAFNGAQLTYDSSTEAETLMVGLGLTQALSIPGTTEVFALDDVHAVRYETGQLNTTAVLRARDVSLHAGAGYRSALAATASGVAVIGGRDGDRRVTEISVVPTIAGPATVRALAHAREGASAVSMADGLLVAGGQEEGAPLFEWISLTGTANRVFGEGLPARSEGALALSPDGRTAFYYLGRSSDGSLPSTSYVITGCPTSCSAVLGVETSAPRARPAITERETATVVLGGTLADMVSSASTVEEIRFPSTGTVTLAPLGALRFSRRDLSAVTLGGGTVLVAGGRDDENDLATMELCFPEALDTLFVP
jgi:hypothetical protein